jgi:threonine/homoserine/homoserine lactone efflux protein
MSPLSPETFAALIGFAFATVWTPGPNNAMLAASGATFGWRPTLPHVLGVAFGFPLMLFLVALGLGEVFRTVPAIATGLTWIGCAVMLWIAWRIGTAGAPGTSRGGRGRPFTFVEATGFQWINPKAWAMSIGVSATYASGVSPALEAAVVAAVFAACGFTSAMGWTLFGAGIGRLLGTGARLRAFNMAMGGLLALSALALALGR